MNELPRRKQIRMEQYDYSSNGAYFITICTKDRQPVFWEFHQGLCSVEEISLSWLGQIVAREIGVLDSVYEMVTISKWCIMPDHVHMVIEIDSLWGASSPSIPRIINQFKGAVSRKAGQSVWQARYYDHAIRNGEDYLEIWQYIDNNPLKYILRDEL